MYLIPDNVNVIPIKESNVGLFAEFTESMSSYKSVTSSSINGQASASVGLPAEGLGVSGSFGAGHQAARLQMYQQDSSVFISRVTARYDRYRVNTQPDMPLAPALRKRVLQIAESYQLGHKAQGRYLSQVLVRDFGTHVITSVDAGALYTKEDILTKTDKAGADVTSKSLKIGAGLAFAAAFESDVGPVQIGAQFGIDYGSGGSKQTLSDYQNRVTHSTVTSYGGLPVNVSGSSDSWLKSLNNHLVTVDRRGQPIHEFITSIAFPELPTSLIVDVQTGVKNAFIAYYKHNTYRGCTNPSASNFDIAANVDSGACKSTAAGHLIGGVYQTCQMTESDAGDLCSAYSHKNPLTQGNSCPPGYTSVHLVTGHIQISSDDRHCKGFWFWKKCKNTPKFSSGVYDAYWCAADTDNDVDMKMYFGGIYTSSRPNDLTGNMACPNSEFQALRLGEDINVCIGTAPIQGYGFGGMFSCTDGNAMTLNSTQRSSQNKMPKVCPSKFTQRFLTLVDDCEVEYCSNVAEPSSMGRVPALLRPPYVKQPYPNKEQTSKLDVTLINNEGELFKNEKAYTKMTELKDLGSKMKTYKASSESLELLSTSWSDLTPSATNSFTESPSLFSQITDQNYFGENELPTPVVAVIASLATVVCIGLATAFVAVCRRRSRISTRLYTEVKSTPDDEIKSHEPTTDDNTHVNILIQPASYGST